MAYIQIKNLTKKYKNLLAVDNFSLDIEKGEVLGIVGPNGAGKTTLVSMLNTRIRPTLGTAILAGLDIIKNGHEIRKIIGVVFQEQVIDEQMTAFNNLIYQGMLYQIPKKERIERANHLLDLVGLSDVAKKEVSKFSGGMKRRIEIARGLMNKPKILFLDEPTLGLDPLSRSKIWNYIKMLNKEHNMTILINTNYMQEAEVLCEKIVIMNKGRLIVKDRIERLKDSLRGDIIDIKIKQVTKAKELFSKTKYVKDSEAYEDYLRLFVSKGESKIEKVIETLKSNNIRLKSITLKKPSLDDIFLHYCGEELK